jgi:hypothetical protein
VHASRRVARDEGSSRGASDERHLHVRIVDERTTYYDLVTEYLQAAGKAPDWFWRLVGSFGHHEAERMEEIVANSFEAGAYTAHDHPEDLEFDWVTEEECEAERHEAEEPAEEEAPPAPSSRPGPRKSSFA